MFINQLDIAIIVEDKIFLKILFSQSSSMRGYAPLESRLASINHPLVANVSMIINSIAYRIKQNVRDILFGEAF